MKCLIVFDNPCVLCVVYLLLLIDGLFSGGLCADYVEDVFLVVCLLLGVLVFRFWRSL
jgi:hypothetical protein